MAWSFPNGQPTTQNLPADLLLPQGRNGPAFLAFPDFPDLSSNGTKVFIYTHLGRLFRHKAGRRQAPMTRAIPAREFWATRR